MRVAIVGAGIAGLGTALAVERHGRGDEVDLFEQASDLTPVGAGIVLAPNAIRALVAAGVAEDDLDAIALRGVSGGIRRADGTWLSRVDVDTVTDRVGASAALHRADLVSLLADRLRHTRVHLATRVTVSQLTAYDVVVGADGINSRIRRDLSPGLEPVGSGIVAWRFVAEPGPGRASDERHGFEAWGNGELAGVVPLHDGRTYVYAARREPSGGAGADLSWLDAWPDPLPDLVARVDPATVLRHELWSLPALPSFVGRTDRVGVALVGDAAHAMLPFLGQGACQGLEDAVELALHLGDLAGYDAVRRQRAQTVQRRSAQAARIALLRGRGARLRDGVVRRVPQALVQRSLERAVSWLPSR